MARRGRSAKRIIVVALPLVPVVIAFVVMTRFWVPVPYWDEWATPGDQLIAFYRGTLSFSDLWSQHNESRKFFPRLLYLLLIPSLGWDVRHLMALTFALVCLGSAGLYLLLRATTSAPSSALAAPWGIMNLLLFSPGEYWNFLLGIQLEPFTPAVALLFAILANLSQKSLRWKTWVCGALALLSTYTFANGMLLWLLACPLDRRVATSGTPPAGRRERLLCYGGYAAAGVLAIGCYFVSYEHPPLAPEWALPLADPAALIRFFLIWLGSLFLLPWAAWLGAAVLLLFGLLSIAAARTALQRRDWRRCYPWLTLGCYTLASGAITALARLQFGQDAASHLRYGTFTVWLYIAVIGLGWAFWLSQPKSRVGRPILFAGAAVVLVLFGAALRPSIKVLETESAQRKHLLLVMRWAPAIPQNPELSLLSPYPGTGEKIRTLYSLGVLRPEPVAAPLSDIAKSLPLAADGAAGRLDRVAIDHVGQLTVEGSARSAVRDAPADAVVIGYRTTTTLWTPYVILDPAAEGRHNAPGRDGAFRRVVPAADLPGGAVTFHAWSIDLQAERALPLNAVPLQRLAPKR